MRNIIVANQLKVACAIAGVTYAGRSIHASVQHLSPEDQFFCTANSQEVKAYFEAIAGSDIIAKIKAAANKVKDFVARHTLLRIVANTFLFVAWCGLMLFCIFAFVGAGLSLVTLSPVLALKATIFAFLYMILANAVKHIKNRINESKNSQAKATYARRLAKVDDMASKLKETDAKLKDKAEELKND
jgi:ABC-type multidrug transport system fused ATPase/permease subunit